MVNEAALVPISLQESKLSPKQQEEAFKSARKYLTEQRIPLESRQILSSAVLVMADALRRGLSIGGKVFPDPKERISPYIKDGLQKRTTLIEEARKYSDIVRKTSPFHAEFSGALAIPKSLFLSCNQDLWETRLQSELGEIEQFTDLAQLRETAIGNLASQALSNLPETIKSVSIERFISLDERAKIIRNMISSYVFKGSISPIITIDDLKRMAFAGSISTDLFNQTRLDGLISELDIQKEDLDTVRAFFQQTKEIFSNIPSIPLDNQQREADFFYSYFGRDLLLLHPALEEEKIVTDPAKIIPGSLSLWDRGLVINGLLLPQPDKLLQAYRQTSAKGYLEEASKLQKAISVWRWYEKTMPELKGRVEKAEQKLSLLNQMLQSALNGDELPREAFSIVYRDQEIAKAKSDRQEQITSGIHRVIADNIRQREAAKQYQRFLTKKYGEVLPETVEAPAIIDIREKENQIKLDKSRIRDLKRSLKLYDKMLSLDYFWSKGFSRQTLSLTIPESSKVLIEAFEANIQHLDQLQTGKVNVKQLYDQQVSYLFKEYRTWLKLDSKEKFALPSELYKWLDKWGEIESSKKVPDKEIKKEMLISLAQLRAGVLNRALRHSKEYDHLIDTSNNLREDIKRLRGEDLAVFSNTRKWDRQEAVEFIQQIEASVPNIEGMNRNEIRNMANKAKKTLRFRYPLPGKESILPPECLDTKGTRLFINIRLQELAGKLDRIAKSISEIEGNFTDNLNPEQRKSLSGQYHKLLFEQTNLAISYNWALDINEILISPLFSLEKCKGLPMNAALDALSDRAGVAKALCEIDESEQLSQEMREYYLDSVRNIYTQTLKHKITSQEEEIHMLKSTGLKGQLATRIDLMGLAIKV